MTWTNYSIATSQTPTKAEHGQIFYVNAVSNIIIPANATSVVLSAQMDGVGQTRVDDVVHLTLIDQANIQDRFTYSHDYSKGCSGTVYFDDPLDMKSLDGFGEVLGKTVTATIEFWDKCGGLIHGTSFFICIET